MTDTPEQLFPGVEWARREGFKPGVLCVVIAEQIHLSWRGPGGHFVKYNHQLDGGDGGVICECQDEASAHAWLRAKILEHRDELNRIAPPEMRWVALYRAGDVPLGRPLIGRWGTGEGAYMRTFVLGVERDLPDELLGLADGPPVVVPLSGEGE